MQSVHAQHSDWLPHPKAATWLLALPALLFAIVHAKLAENGYVHCLPCKLRDDSSSKNHFCLLVYQHSNSEVLKCG